MMVNVALGDKFQMNILCISIYEYNKLQCIQTQSNEKKNNVPILSSFGLFKGRLSTITKTILPHSYKLAVFLVCKHILLLVYFILGEMVNYLELRQHG